MQHTILAAIIYFMLHFHTTARKLRKELEIALQALSASYSYSELIAITLTKAHEFG
jgi:hypothetical protein